VLPPNRILSVICSENGGLLNTPEDGMADPNMEAFEAAGHMAATVDWGCGWSVRRRTK
jgi:hypothetical protein